jgi:hypothetical protein
VDVITSGKTGTLILAVALGACGTAHGSVRDEPLDRLTRPGATDWPGERSISALRERPTPHGMEQHVAFATHPSASAAVSAEILRELEMLPQLIESFTLSADTGHEDLVAMLETYDGWVERNGIEPQPAARALERAAHGQPAIPRGTPPARGHEVAAILAAIAAEADEARSVIEAVDAALAHVDALVDRSRELAQRAHMLAEEDEGSSTTPGLWRSTSANRHRAAELEAHILAVAVSSRKSMGQMLSRSRAALERLDGAVACLRAGRPCGDDRARDHAPSSG